MWAKLDPEELRRLAHELNLTITGAIISAWESELEEDWDDAAPRPAPMPFRYDAEIDGDE